MNAIHKVPDGPKESPYIQALRYIRDPDGFFDGLRDRYGDCFSVRFPGNTYVIFATQEGVKDILAGSADDFHAGEAAALLEFLVGQHALVRLDGAEHERLRKLLAPAFHGERIVSYGTIVRDLTLDTIASWPIGEPTTAMAKMHKLTLAIILHCIFGIPPGAEHERWTEVIIRFLDLSMKPISFAIWSALPGAALRGFLADRIGPLAERLSTPVDLSGLIPGGKLARTIREFDAMIYAYIARRRAEGASGNDVVASMLRARDDDGRAMSDAEIHDQMLGLLVAGHETSSTALSWVLWELLSRDEVFAAAQAELDQVFGDGPIDPMRTRDLPYLEGVIREALRMHSFIPGLGRKLMRPMRIGGVDLPAGVVVVASSPLMHRDRSIWPDPARFDPTRFIRRKPKQTEYYPFGGGLRTCTGMAFAMFEMKLIVALLLRHARLRLASRETPQLFLRGLVCVPSTHVPIVLEERRLPPAWRAGAA